VKPRRLLLDTQAFILASRGAKSLPRKAGAALLSRDMSVYLSLVSLWEMQIKISLGKLKFPVSLPQAIQRAVSDIGLEMLSVQAEHIYKLSDLPFHHRDPFDRLLIAQALHEQMPIVSGDTSFDAYGVARLW